MKTVISNDPALFGERCFLCEELLTTLELRTLEPPTERLSLQGSCGGLP